MKGPLTRVNDWIELPSGKSLVRLVCGHTFTTGKYVQLIGVFRCEACRQKHREQPV